MHGLSANTRYPCVRSAQLVKEGARNRTTLLERLNDARPLPQLPTVVAAVRPVEELSCPDTMEEAQATFAQ